MVLREKRITIEEFDDLISSVENQQRRFELINGGIVEKMPTVLHGVIVHLISGYLFMYLLKNPIGWVTIEGRYQLPKDAENSRIPDISFLLDRKRQLVEQGAAPYMPDLAVEVKSPDDSLKLMSEKADYYLQNGCRMVWLVYPEKRLVEVRTPDDRQLLTEGEAISGGDVLPGFTVAVSDIFPLK